MYYHFTYIADDTAYGCDVAGTRETIISCGKYDWIFRSVKTFSTVEEAAAYEYEYQDLRNPELFECISGNMNNF